MSDDGYKIRNQFAVHFITFAVVEWVDVFTRKLYVDILVENLKYCQKKKGLNIHAWCIMPNHVHLIASSKAPFRLSDILRDFKKFTANKIIEAIQMNTNESRRNWMLWIFESNGKRNNRNEHYQFWQQGNHPIECHDMEILGTRMKYLHQNPVRAGIVRSEEDYLYSSAIDYYTDEKGLIAIDFLK
ncbi:REP-associated tyrosine transposase [Olivibacter sitiensis]|uniref:REP-associated tyrosine transposase n=1 Tax=Olivibacter sitiensis TaxID=376470 RepID=UPI00048924A8|nr:transposase [Olivibacter sitiensis]